MAHPPIHDVPPQPAFANNMYLFYGGYMSNFARAYFTIDGTEYWCVEQWMMAEKARLFGDTDMLEHILAEKSDPWKIKLKYGRNVKNFIREKWDAVSRDRVYVGALEKFRQNPGFDKALLATNDATLVEASPTDAIWGVKLGLDDPRGLDYIANKANWEGTNWLGEVLMRVRDTRLADIAGGKDNGS